MTCWRKGAREKILVRFRIEREVVGKYIKTGQVDPPICSRTSPSMSAKQQQSFDRNKIYLEGPQLSNEILLCNKRTFLFLSNNCRNLSIREHLTPRTHRQRRLSFNFPINLSFEQLF